MALPQRKTETSNRLIINSSCRLLYRRITATGNTMRVLTPGTMVHVGESGDKLWTVRVASGGFCPQRQFVSSAI